MHYLEVHQLKELREKTGLGVRLFSRVSGLSPSTIQKIEACGSVNRNNYEKYLLALSKVYKEKQNIIVEYALIIKPNLDE